MKIELLYGQSIAEEASPVPLNIDPTELCASKMDLQS
jgi:hypothetical protein